MSANSNTDPFGAFFSYAARWWPYHLRSAPVGSFNLDDVLELVGPASARYPALAREYRWNYVPGWDSLTDPLRFLVRYGDVSMLEQLLDQLCHTFT